MKDGSRPRTLRSTAAILTLLPILPAGCVPTARAGTLPATLSLTTIGGVPVAVQDGIAVPSFDFQPRPRIDLRSWRVVDSRDSALLRTDVAHGAPDIAPNHRAGRGRPRGRAVRRLDVEVSGRPLRGQPAALEDGPDRRLVPDDVRDSRVVGRPGHHPGVRRRQLHRRCLARRALVPWRAGSPGCHCAMRCGWGPGSASRWGSRSGRRRAPPSRASPALSSGGSRS